MELAVATSLPITARLRRATLAGSAPPLAGSVGLRRFPSVACRILAEDGAQRTRNKRFICAGRGSGLSPASARGCAKQRDGLPA